MDRKTLRKTVRTLIFEVLSEGETEKADKPKVKAKTKAEPAPKETKPKQTKKSSPGDIRIASGALGRGRFKKFVGEAGARASKEPKQLMKDLGVKGASGGDDIAQVLSILNTAIHKNDIMNQAYVGANKSREQLANGESITGIGIYLAGVDARNGLKFLSHTLSGAKNAGFLKLKGGIELGRGKEAAIFIYSV